MQSKMLRVAGDGRPLKACRRCAGKPHYAGLHHRGACAIGYVGSLAHLDVRRGREPVGVLLFREGLQASLAASIDVIDDPSRPLDALRRPCALAYGQNLTAFSPPFSMLQRADAILNANRVSVDSLD